MRRSGNHSHYENAAEAYLIENKIAYMAINEGKKVFADDRKVKNFDFLVSSNGRIRAIDIKGKQFGYKSAPSNLWENWILEEDILSLESWRTELKRGGVDVNPLLVYVYQLRKVDHHDQFENIFKHKGMTYGLVAISIEDYKVHIKPRGKSPRSVNVSRKLFSSLVKPIDYFI